jgi:ribosomal protein S14
MTKIVALRSSIKIPRISNVRTRKVVCVASGRTRGFNQFTGLSRFKLKDFVERGILPGIYRASW